MKTSLLLATVLLTIGIMMMSIPVSAQKKSKKVTREAPEKITLNVPYSSATSCTVPIGTWGMSPAELLKVLGSKKNVQQLRVDTTYRQTPDETLFDSEHIHELPKTNVPDSLFTTVLFTYGGVNYTYKFKRKSGVLYTVTMQLAGDQETVNRNYNDVYYLLDANSAFQRITSKRTDEERYKTTCGKWIVEIHNKKVKPTLHELKYYRQLTK